MATVRITGERLAAMDDNDMAVYCTPGASQPYWSSRPNFMYDMCVATPEDFYKEYGIDRSDLNKGGFYEDELFDLDVELASAQST